MMFGDGSPIPAEQATPQQLHHLDQIEAWALESADALVQMQAEFYVDRGETPTSRLACSHDLINKVNGLDELQAKALVYVFVSEAAQVVLAQAAMKANIRDFLGLTEDETEALDE